MTYAVVDTQSKIVLQDGFKNRKKAKEVRNSYQVEYDTVGSPRFVVTNGTSHPNGPSVIFKNSKVGKLEKENKQKKAKTVEKANDDAPKKRGRKKKET